MRADQAHLSYTQRSFDECFEVLKREAEIKKAAEEPTARELFEKLGYRYEGYEYDTLKYSNHYQQLVFFPDERYFEIRTETHVTGSLSFEELEAVNKQVKEFEASKRY